MATDSKPSADNLWHKVIAGVFGTVMAPVLVAFGIKWSDKLTAPADEKPAAVSAAAAPVASAAPATTAAPAATAPAGVANAPAATQPVATVPAAGVPVATAPVANVSVSAPPAATGSVPARPNAEAASSSASTGSVSLPSFKKPLSPVQRLFNGRDLTGFYTYIGKPSHRAKPQGKNHDPDKIFTVQDGMLHISGEHLGLLETEKSYTDYWLTVVYKWGEKTWPPEENEARHSAILVAIDGPDGVLRSAFPASFHIQLNEGNAGDILIAAAPGEEHLSLTAAVEEKKLGKLTSPCYTPGARAARSSKGSSSAIRPTRPGTTSRDISPPTAWRCRRASGTRWTSSA